MEIIGFGKRLKGYRTLHKINQAKLAKTIGVSIRTIASWESDEATPTKNKILFIAKTINVNAKWLLSGEGDSATSKTATTDEIMDDEISKIINAYRTLNRQERDYFYHAILAASLKTESIVDAETRIDSRLFKKLMREYFLTQNDIAEYLNIKQTSISRALYKKSGESILFDKIESAGGIRAFFDAIKAHKNSKDSQ